MWFFGKWFWVNYFLDYYYFVVFNLLVFGRFSENVCGEECKMIWEINMGKVNEDMEIFVEGGDRRYW